MDTKFILGAGISGLVYAYYNRNYRIISTDLGGKLSREILACTVLLHKTPETQKLLEDLSVPAEPMAHIVRYFYQGHLHEGEVPIAVEQMLVMKKLTPWHTLPTINISPLDSALSTIASYIPKYKIRTSEVIKQLAAQVDWIKDRVLRITPTSIVTEKGAIYEYTDLVSTIPAPEFWMLYEQPERSREFKYLPITYIYSETNPVPEANSAWDLIYFVDYDVKYTRVNRDPRTGLYLYEFTGEISREEVKHSCPTINIKDYFVQPYGVIVSDFNNIPPPNVRFIGRFAKWDHRDRIEDVIKESLMRYDFVSVWNYQKAFNSKFFNYNVQDIELQQRLTKDFILLVTDEAHELLEQINWKIERYREVQVDKKQILEEWIDVFKYWLGIGNVWGFTPEDFFNEFWRKSKIVESKYPADLIKRIRESLNTGRR